MCLHKGVMENYHDVDGDDSNKKGIIEILKEAYSDNKKRRFFNQMLQKADLNIIDYKPVLEDRYIPQEFRERIMSESIPEDMKEAL